jgi:hypothetical protein
MLMKVMSVPLLATALLGPTRCEAEGVDTNPYTGWFHADRIAILHPAQDYACENSVVGWFKLENHDYAVIDFECDLTIDAIMREDGLLLMVLPGQPGERINRVTIEPKRPWLNFNPVTDVDWESIINDGSPSPFSTQTTGRWLESHALLAPADQTMFRQLLFVEDWSPEHEMLDVTIQTTNELRRVAPGNYGLEYRWFAAKDEFTGVDCWSIRARGSFHDMARWLIDCGFHRCGTINGPVDSTCTYLIERSVVECRRGGAVVATLNVP